MVNHPEILWAQRSSEYEPEKNLIFLSIAVPELDPSYELSITPTNISFKGHSTPPAPTGTAAKVDPKEFEFNLDLFAEVEEVKRVLNGKNLALVLKKKEASEDYWPRLTKDKVKINFLKTDFSKWKDQDEQEDEEPEAEAEPQGPPGGGMGGMGGAGGMDFASMMGGAGGAGGMDFEKMMAQMKGMGGAGGPGGDDGEYGGEGDDAPEDDDSDDDGPPPLEDA